MLNVMSRSRKLRTQLLIQENPASQNSCEMNLKAKLSSQKIFTFRSTILRMRSTLISLLLMTWSFVLQAADIQRFGKMDQYVALQGDIKAGDADKLFQVLRDGDLLFVNSNGGSASEALKINETLSLFENVRVIVGVDRGYRCASACAIAALGVSKHNIFGPLDFHYGFYRHRKKDDLDPHERLYLNSVNWEITKRFIAAGLTRDQIALIQLTDRNSYQRIQFNSKTETRG